MKKWLLCIILTVLWLPLFCQIEIIKQEDVFRKGRRNSVQIKIVNNTILLPVQLQNNLKVYFILDTGVTNPIITDDLITALLPLTIERSFQLKGYGMDKPLRAFVADGFEYSVGHFKKKIAEKVIILEEPIALNEFLGEPVYGILGYSFLKNYNVKIDYQRELIYLREPEEEQSYPKRYQSYDVEWIGNRAYIQLPVKNQTYQDTLKLLIDTGFTGAMNLYPEQAPLLQPNQPYIDHYLGIGLNGLITSKLFKIDALLFDDGQALESVTANLLDRASLINTTIQDYSDGSIGNEILRRFLVVIDYENNRLLLKKRRSFSDEFHYNASGIRIKEKTNDDGKKMYVISHLRLFSHAYFIGLLIDDEIVSIDGKRVNNKPIEELYERLNDFSEPFRELVVKRNEIELTFEFKINTSVPWN